MKTKTLICVLGLGASHFVQAASSYTITIPNGCKLIANQLDHTGAGFTIDGNTLNHIMPSLPDGCLLSKYNNSSGTWTVTSYSSALGAWGNGDAITLNPGEGALLCTCGNGSFNLTFTGIAHSPVTPVSIPSGSCYLLSCQSAITGTYENIVGSSPPPDGTMVYKYNGGYSPYTYDGFDQIWDPTTPTAAVGESMWISAVPGCPSPPLPPSVSCPANKTVACGASLDFDLPTVSGCSLGSNLTVAIFATTTNSLCPPTITRTWQITDLCSNVIYWSQTVIVVSTNSPVLSCPADKTVNCGTNWSFDTPTAAYDPCLGTNVTVGILSTVTNGLCPPVATRIWFACGDPSVTCTQAVTLVDTTPPVITCVGNKTVSSNSSWGFDTPGAYDTCCGSNVTVQPIGTNLTVIGSCLTNWTVTWQASDCCSNTSFCSQTVTVMPAVSLRTNIWVSSGGGAWANPANWSLGAPQWLDSLWFTNAFSKVITNDSSSSPCSQIISNLTLGAPLGYSNTFLLLHAPTNPVMHLLGNLTLQGRGNLTLADSPLQVDGQASIGASSGTVGFTLNSGTARFGSLVAGSSSNSLGQVNVSGGWLDVLGNFTAGAGPNTCTGIVSVTGGWLSVSNGILGVGNAGNLASGNGNGSLFVSNSTVNAASIQLGSATGGSGSMIVESGGTVNVLGGFSQNDCEVRSNGLLQVLYNPTGFPFEDPNLHNRVVGGYQRDGTLTVSGGTVLSPEMVFGLTNGTGTLSMTNGTVITSNLFLGLNASGTGVVNVAGGSLMVTGGVARLGPQGTAQMTISGGNHTISSLYLGGTNGTGTGALYGYGGYLKILGVLDANFVLVSGIDLDGSGGSIIIGDGHDAEVQVASGVATNFLNMTVGYSAGFVGTYTQNGGLTQVTNNLLVGNCASGAQGVVYMNGGATYVTNDTGTAFVSLQQGTITMDPGSTLITDTLDLSSPCAQGNFIYNGGTIHYGQLLLPQSAPPLRLTITYQLQAQTVTVSWPSIYIGYVLMQSQGVPSTGWSAVQQAVNDNRVTRSVVIPVSPGRMFFRLSKP